MEGATPEQDNFDFQSNFENSTKNVGKEMLRKNSWLNLTKKYKNISNVINLSKLANLEKIEESSKLDIPSDDLKESTKAESSSEILQKYEFFNIIALEGEDSTYQLFCKYAEYEKYEENDIIYSQLTRASHFYFILQGKVAFLKKKPVKVENEVPNYSENKSKKSILHVKKENLAGLFRKHGKKLKLLMAFKSTGLKKKKITSNWILEYNIINQLEEGSHFGNEGLLAGLNRTEDAISTDNTILLIIKREHFNEIIEHYEEKVLRQRYGFLKSLQIFKKTDEILLTEFYFGSEKKFYSRGQILFSEGDSANYFFMIKSGLIKITKKHTFELDSIHEKSSNRRKNHVLEMFILGPGETIGEIDLILQRNHDSTAFCDSSIAELIVIKKNLFYDHLRKDVDSRVYLDFYIEKKIELYEQRLKEIIRTSFDSHVNFANIKKQLIINKYKHEKNRKPHNSEKKIDNDLSQKFSLTERVRSQNNLYSMYDETNAELVKLLNQTISTNKLNTEEKKEEEAKIDDKEINHKGDDITGKTVLKKAGFVLHYPYKQNRIDLFARRNEFNHFISFDRPYSKALSKQSANDIKVKSKIYNADYQVLKLSSQDKLSVLNDEFKKDYSQLPENMCTEVENLDRANKVKMKFSNYPTKLNFLKKFMEKNFKNLDWTENFVKEEPFFLKEHDDTKHNYKSQTAITRRSFYYTDPDMVDEKKNSAMKKLLEKLDPLGKKRKITTSGSLFLMDSPEKSPQRVYTSKPMMRSTSTNPVMRKLNFLKAMNKTQNFVFKKEDS